MLHSSLSVEGGGRGGGAALKGNVKLPQVAGRCWGSEGCCSGVRGCSLAPAFGCFRFKDNRRTRDKSLAYWACQYLRMARWPTSETVLIIQPV